jgi:hypothetical protein
MSSDEEPGDTSLPSFRDALTYAAKGSNHDQSFARTIAQTFERRFHLRNRPFIGDVDVLHDRTGHVRYPLGVAFARRSP